MQQLIIILEGPTMKSPDAEMITFQIDKEIKEAAVARAKEHDRPLSSYMRQLILTDINSSKKLTQSKTG